MARFSTSGLRSERNAYSRTYKNLLGLSLSENEDSVSPREFVYLENLYRDHTKRDGAALETIPGFRRLYAFGKRIHGIFRYSVGGSDYVMIHAGMELYRFDVTVRDSLSSLSPLNPNMTYLAENESTAFLFGENFYLLDGREYFCVTPNGQMSRVKSRAYRPVTYLDGKPYEPRNILTPTAIERMTLGESERYTVSSDGLVYQKNSDGQTASVTGVADPYRISVLTIPESVTIGGQSYRVTEIASFTFRGSALRCLHLPPSLETVGAYAFESCKRLTSVILPDSVKKLGSRAFANCTTLSYVHIGRGVTTWNVYAFGGCTALSSMSYARDREAFLAIDCTAYIDSDPATPESYVDAGIVRFETEPLQKERGAILRLPLSEQFSRIYTVKLNGESLKTAMSPFFLPNGENLLSPLEIATNVNENTSFLLLNLTSYGDGSFTVNGYSDDAGTFVLGNVTPPAGEYLLSGCPKNDGAYHLEAKYTLPNTSTPTVVRDTGDGARISLPADGIPVEISFYIAEGISFDNLSVAPRLLLPTGSIAYKTENAQNEDGTYIGGLTLTVTDADALFLNTLEIAGVLQNVKSAVTEDTPAEEMGENAVLLCRRAALYDGRIFLTGNPQMKNTVFYAARNRDGHIDPSYFSVYNYFRDGSGESENRAMFATPSGLCILKAGEGEESHVYLHTGEDSESDLCPRIYPAVLGYADAVATGGGLTFFGEPVYLTKNGICSFSFASFSGERRRICLSEKINRALRAYDPDRLRLVPYGEYLVLSTGTGEVYLGDRERRVGNDYTFYRLTGIGSYTGDRDAYEYAASLPYYTPDMYISEKAGQLVTLPVFRQDNIPYVYENGTQYACVARGEKSGGVFSPANRFLAVGELLFFTTENGDLCLFNTDKRDENGEIPAEYYSFMGHRYTSRAVFPPDDCALPYLTKCTLPHATALRLSGFVGGRVRVTATANNNEKGVTHTLFGGSFDFGELDFNNLHFSNDRERIFPMRCGIDHFQAIQYAIHTDDYRVRFGLCELSFCYTKGRRIKR